MGLRPRYSPTGPEPEPDPVEPDAPEQVAEPGPERVVPTADTSPEPEVKRRPLPAHLAAMSPTGGAEFIEREGFDPTILKSKRARQIYAPQIKAVEGDRKRTAAVSAFNTAEDARVAEVTKAASAKQAKKDRNATKEAYFRTHGIRTFIDANGEQQPILDEEGRVQFSKKTGTTQYDEKTGDAFRVNRDELGTKTREDLDAEAPIGSHKDAPNRIFRQNKHTGWTDLGTIDENLNSPDARIAAGAAAAKTERDKYLGKAAAKGFGLAGNALAEQHHEGQLAYDQYNRGTAQFDQRIAQVQAHPEYNAREGGLFGMVGTHPTAQAKALQAEVADLQTQKAQVPAVMPPDPKALKEGMAQVRTSASAFAALVEKHGGDVNEAAREYRAQIAQYGGDPNADPALAHLERTKKEIGMPTFADEANDENMKREAEARKHPAFGPLMTQRDALDQEQVRINQRGFEGASTETEQANLDMKRDEMARNFQATAEAESAKQEEAQAKQAQASERDTKLRRFNHLKAAETGRLRDAQDRYAYRHAGDAYGPALEALFGPKESQLSYQQEDIRTKGKAKRDEFLAGIPEEERAAFERDAELTDWKHQKAQFVKTSDGRVRFNPAITSDPAEFEKAITKAHGAGTLTDEQRDAAMTEMKTAQAEKRSGQIAQARETDSFKEFAAKPAMKGKSDEEVYSAYEKDFGALTDGLVQAAKGFGQGAKQNFSTAIDGAKILALQTMGDEKGKQQAAVELIDKMLAAQEQVSPGDDTRDAANKYRTAGNTSGQFAAQMLPVILAAVATKGRGATAVATGGNIARAVNMINMGLQYGADGYQSVVQSHLAQDGKKRLADYTEPEQETIHQEAMRAFVDNMPASVTELLPIEKATHIFGKLGKTRMGRLVDTVLLSPGSELAQEYISQKVTNAIVANASSADAQGQQMKPEEWLGMAAGVLPFSVGHHLLEKRAQNKNFAKQQEALTEMKGITQGIPAEAVEDLAVLPTEAAKALGAKDTSGLAQEVEQIDAQIADLDAQLETASESQGALVGVDREARNDLAEKLLDLHVQRLEATREGFKSAQLNDAANAIDAIPKHARLANAVNAEAAGRDTQNVARAMVKIATGQPMEKLTTQERTALEAPAPDGLPRVEKVKGKLVLTQGAIDRLREIAPEAAALIRQSEAERRDAILAPETASKAPPGKPQAAKAGTGTPQAPGGSSANSTNSTAPQDGTTSAGSAQRSKLLARHLQNAGATREEAEQYAANFVAQEGVGDYATQRDEIARRFRERKPADAEAEAHKSHAELAADLAEEATKSLEKEGVKVSTPAARRNIAEMASIMAPAIAKHRKAFDEIRFAVTSQKSGGVLSHDARSLTINIADVLAAGNYEDLSANPELVNARIQEEAIHGLVRTVVKDSEVLSMWEQLPEPVKDLVREAYLDDPKKDKARNDGVKLGHEYLRMIVQNKLGDKLTEAASPTLLEMLKDILGRVLAHLKNLRAELTKGNVSPATIDLIETATDKVAAAYKQIVGDKRTQAPYGAEHEQSNATVQGAPAAGAKGETNAGKAGTPGGTGSAAGPTTERRDPASNNDEVVDSKRGGRGNASVGDQQPGGNASGDGEVDTGGRGATGRAEPELDPTEFPVREVPVADIQLSKDVPNFKKGANPKTGTIPGNELKGEKYIRLGKPPIVLWERENGRLEVITGRHRLQKAKRLGEATIPSQIVREADGFTRDMALTFDAESNITDDQGDIDDYAHYFRNYQADSGGLDEAAARARGLLDRAKGRAGWDIGKNASDDTYALFSADKISAEQAVAIARTAPGNDALQRIGVKYALDDRAADFVANMMLAAREQYGTRAESLDLFGSDDSALQQAEMQAKRASSIMRGIRAQVSSVQGAAKRPELARSLGVNVEDPAAVQAKIDELKGQIARWENWPMHADLVKQTRQEQAPPLAARATPEIRRLLELQRGASDGSLKPSQHAELVRLEKKHGQEFMGFFDDGKADTGFRLEQEFGRETKFEAPEATQMPLLSRQSVAPEKLKSVLISLADGPATNIAGRLTVPGTTLFDEGLGVPRNLMPQVPGDHMPEFLEVAKEFGIDFREETVDATKLKPTQSELDGAAIGRFLRMGKEFKSKPIMVSSDDYVIDGHHRWGAVAAQQLAGDVPGMAIRRFDAPAKDMLALAAAFMSDKGIEPRSMTDHNYAQSPEKVRQASMAIRDLAEQHKDEFLDHVRGASKAAGLAFSEKGAEFAVKSERSLETKLKRKAERVPTDLLRATAISHGNIAEMKTQARRFIVQLFRSGYRIYSPNGKPDVEDRFNGTAEGYKDINIKLVRPGDPVVREVLILQPAMLAAKAGKLHKEYDRLKKYEIALKNTNLTDSARAFLEGRRQKSQNQIALLTRIAFRRDNLGYQSAGLPSTTSFQSSEPIKGSDSASTVSEASASALSPVTSNPANSLLSKPFPSNFFSSSSTSTELAFAWAFGSSSLTSEPIRERGQSVSELFARRSVADPNQIGFDFDFSPAAEIEPQAEGAPASSLPPTSIQEPENERKATAADATANLVKEELGRGTALSWNWLFDTYAKEIGGSQADGKFTPKDAYDALELGINRFIQERAFSPAVDAAQALQTIAHLKTMLAKVPTQSKRTSETDEFQQFSTVPPLAFTAAWAANLGPGDVVLEPSAGIGGLAVFAKTAGAEVIQNELSERRAAILRKLNLGQVFTENAEQIDNVLPPSVRPTAVLMNPPFSATAGRMQGARDTSNAIKHVEQALARLEPGSRLVMIVGEGMAHNRPAFRAWWEKIARQYGVRANIAVNGAEYAKYGTTWDNQLVIIDKPLPGEEKALTPEPLTRRVEKIEDLIPLLESIRNDRKPSTRSTQGERGGTGPADVDAQPDRAGTTDPDVGTGGIAEPQQQGMGEPALGGERPATSGESTPGVVRGRSASNGEGGRLPGGSERAGESANEPVERAEVSAGETASADKLTDSVFDSYRPRVTVPGSTMPPVKVQESAAMASVSPVKPTYRPAIPAQYYQPQGGAAEGRLSALAMESIILAGNAHQDFVPLAYTDEDRQAHRREHGDEPPEQVRRGFFIGDGTGMGKGRQVAGIMLDNWMQGRKKAIWITEKPALIADAKRDLDDVAGMAKDVFELGKTKLGAPVDRATGIAFVSYATLRSEEKAPEPGQRAKSRADQLVEWFGKDFDGVIAFDEAHNMANNTVQKGSRGLTKPSAQALIGIELQRRLPNARIVYLSATGATEVANLGYAERLGIWGPGTPFANKGEFIESVSSGGVAAMELVARDLKALGLYVARAISWEGVTYGKIEHPLSADQREIYDTLAEGWQNVLGEMDKALEVIGAVATDPETGDQRTLNKNAKSAARSAFWGSHQRFFNQVITSMKMPSVLRSADEASAQGKAVIMQLVNTNEAAQNRAIAKRRADAAESGEQSDFEDLDLTPRDILMQMVEHSFPVTQQEEYTVEVDGKAQVRMRPAHDSKGNPILNRRAVAMRDALLDKISAIRVPDGPLEMILNHFGQEKVAEVTGRTQRIEWGQDEDGNRVRKPVRRSKAHGMREAGEFMDDKRPVLVFSNAGGTGRSYHADRKAKNQRERFHILVQPGWQAAQAVQGFGRSHRNNQAQPPHYELATTDIAGEKRFMSSIARRLDQLGALTKGQRQTGSQGFFKSRDNLESEEARAALRRFYFDALSGSIDGISPDVLEQQMGLRLRDKEGNVLDELPPITQFLNRVLSLSLGLQERVFGAFSERMDRIVEAAIAAGTLDQGLENLSALSTKISEERVIYTDARTGAETRYAKLDMEQENEKQEFPAKAPRYFVNVRSGSVWAERFSRNVTDTETGSIDSQVRLAGVTREQNVEAAALRDGAKWRRADEDEARGEWDRQFREAPATRHETVHFITGTILPVWDRLNVADRTMRVVRAQTDDGRRMIGMVIRPSEMEKVMRNFGEEGEAPKADEAAQRILAGATARLSNGWRLKRSRVSSEERIEIIGPTLTHHAEMDTAGVFRERIAFATRYFVPVDRAAEVIGKLTENRPIVEVTGGTQPELASRPSRDTGTYYFDFENGDTPAARIRNNIGMVDSIANRFRNIPGADIGDIKGKARQALVRAAKGYDASHGEFAPYASTAVRNSLRDLFEKELRYRRTELQTLNEPNGNMEEPEDRIAGLRDKTVDVAREATNRDGAQVLNRAIATLPEKLQVVVRGVMAGDTLETIGERDLAGMTRSGVSNRAQIAYTRLRQKLGEMGLQGTDDVLGLNSRATPASPGAKGFNPYEAIAALQRLAASEVSGQRTTGRPDLALGASDPQIMGVDAWREGVTKPQTMAEWEAEADTMLADNRAGVRRLIIQRGMTPGGTLNPAETIAAKKLVAQEMKRAFSDPAKRNDVAFLINAYRQTGTEAAREMRARVDPEMTPEDRHREFLGKLIFTPPPEIQTKLDKATTAEQRKAILQDDQARVTRIEKELAKMGVSLDDIMKGEVALRLKGAKFIENAAQAFAAKEREALRMIQANRAWSDIAKHTGLTEAQIKAVETKLFDTFVKKHLGKFKAGATAANVDLEALASRASAATATLTDADAMEEARKAFVAMGFGRGTAQGRKPFSLSNPVQVVRVARTIQAIDARPWDMAYEAWINGILSGPATHTANIAGNLANLAWDFTVQRGLEALLNATIFHDPNSAQLGEASEIARGIMPGLARGLRLAAQSWSAENDFFRHDVLGEPVTLGRFDKGGLDHGAIPGRLGRVVRIPGRSLLFADAFFKGLMGQMQAGAEAHRMAKAEGLTGKAMAQRIDSLVQTPNSPAWQRAVDKAVELTFQEDVRTAAEGGNMVEDIAARVQRLRSDNKLFALLVPFVRTPYNIFRIGLRKSPLGAANLLSRFAAAGFYRIKDGKPIGESYLPAEAVKHLAEQLLAWAGAALMYGAVQGDDDDDDKPLLITGSLPASEVKRGERELQQRAFGGDYTIRIGGRNGTVIHYGRFEPFATVLGTTVDAIRQLKKGTPAADKLDGLFGYFLAQAQSKTFVQGIADFISAMQDPENKAGQVGKRFLSTVVPNIIRQPLRNVDDYVRDSRGGGLPYQMLPTENRAERKTDAYGKDMEKAGTSLSRLFFAAPIKPYAELENADKLLLAWNHANPGEKWAPEPLQRSIKIKGATREMTPAEYREAAQRAGERVRSLLAGRLTPAQVTHPREQDLKIVKDAFEAGRHDAREMIKRKAATTTADAARALMAK